MDVVQLVKDGKGQYEWHEVESEQNGYKLQIKVFRDAMKFDDIPPMTWDFRPIVGDHRKFNGVRLPATAHQLQQIADLLGGMLMTPKVIDMIWLQAELKFDAIVNIGGRIVGTSDIHRIHNSIENKITSLGGDDGTKLISCVGKYWCLINELQYAKMIKGDWASCNYGWFAKTASGPGITPGTSCWQRPGYQHNKIHWDPSQVIRIMNKHATLIDPKGEKEIVNLKELANDKELAKLFHHQGQLKYIRQKGVTELEPLPDYTIKIKNKPPGLSQLE